MRSFNFLALLRVLIFLPTLSSAVNDRAGAHFQLVGCDDRNVDGLYDDALRLAENAVEWLDKIPSRNVFSSREVRNAANNLHFMFGIKKDDLDEEDFKARLKYVRDAYVKVINALATGQGMPLTDSFLICGDTSLLQTNNMGDLGPLGAPQNVFDAMYRGNRVWYADQPRTPGTDTARVIFTTLPISRPPICFDAGADSPGQNVAGQTFHPRPVDPDPSQEIVREALDQSIRKIVICDMVWEEERFKATILGDKGKDAGVTQSPDSIINRGGVLLHEMFHIMDTQEPGVYQWEDKLLASGEKAYLFSKSVKLAKENWLRAITNPDSYKIFADMVWWSKTEWHGDAPKKPENSRNIS